VNLNYRIEHDEVNEVEALDIIVVNMHIQEMQEIASIFDNL